MCVCVCVCGGGAGGGGVSEPCKVGGLRKNPFLFRSLQLPARILLSFNFPYCQMITGQLQTSHFITQ